MTLALAYWILMLLQLVFGLWSNWPAPGGSLRSTGSTLLLFLLLLIVGWKVFGAPLKT